MHNAKRCAPTAKNPVGDEKLPSERAARREAFRRHNVPTSRANEYEIQPRFDDPNSNLRGPNNEPWHMIKTTDVNGRPVEIPRHSNGHTFTDRTPVRRVGGHYHGPDGPMKGHLYYPPFRGDEGG